jgi:hypothetical protein
MLVAVAVAVSLKFHVWKVSMCCSIRPKAEVEGSPYEGPLSA